MFAPGGISRRGETLQVTPELRALNVDANGKCFFDLTEEEQVGRWGSVKFAAGAAPAAINVWDNDPFLQDKMRSEAALVANALADPVERARALAEVRERFGVRSTQHSTFYRPSS